VVRRGREELVRAGLEAFSSLRANDDEALESALAAAASRSEALLSSMLWSPTDRAQAEALATVAELATGTVEPTQLIAAQGRIVSVAPQLALLAIRASVLRATTMAAEPAVDEPVVDEPVADEAAAAGPDPDSSCNSPEPDSDVPDGSDPVADPVEEAPPAVKSEQSTPAETQAVSSSTDAAAAHTPSTASDQPDTTTQQGTSEQDDAEQTEPDLAGPVARLVAQGRHALAAEVSARCATQPVDPDLLRASALATAVRNPHGQVAAALHQRIASLDSATIGQDTTALLLATPALLRTALVTGEPAAGAVLLALQPHLGVRLGKLASEVGRRAVTGVPEEPWSSPVAAVTPLALRGKRWRVLSALTLRRRSPLTLIARDDSRERGDDEVQRWWPATVAGSPSRALVRPHPGDRVNRPHDRASRGTQCPLTGAAGSTALAGPV